MKDAVEQALDLLGRAIARDPHYAPALALAAFCHSQLRTFAVSAAAAEPSRLFAMVLHAGLPGVSDAQLPVSLTDGQSAHLYMSYKDIDGAIVSQRRTQKTKLTAICVDSLGNVYKGDPWNVDPQEFLRSKYRM